MLCGHTSCGGVAAALGNKKLGLIDTWLMPLRALRKEHLDDLSKMEPKDAALRLVELNVRDGVRKLRENPVIVDAVGERGLKIHGLVYTVGDGTLKELDCTEDELTVKSRYSAFHIEA